MRSDGRNFLTFRYFVRSYVTHPTTARAMTDTPANTPNPMGRTESVLPGTVAAAVAGPLEDSGSEADDDDVVVAPPILGLGRGVEIGVVEVDRLGGGTEIELDT